MAAAVHDIKSLVGRNRAQSARSYPLVKRISFADTNVLNGEDAEFVIIPGSTLVRSMTPIIVTPEGAAGTMTVGTETAPALMGTVDLNAAAGSVVSVAELNLAVSGGFVQGEVQSIADKADEIIAALGTNGLHGWYFAADTPLRATAGANLSTAEVLLLFDCFTFDA